LRFVTPKVGLGNERFAVEPTLTGSGTRSDVRCAVASVAPSCPLPEPHR
jgi:hypothetical protein